MRLRRPADPVAGYVRNPIANPMLKSLLLLITLTILWTLAVWFVLPLNLSTLSYPNLVLLHGLPPLTLLVVWLVLRAWRRRHKIRALARQQAVEEAQRQEVMATARQQREVEAAHQRFGCDCRAVVVTGLGGKTSTLKAALPENVANEDDIKDEFELELATELEEEDSAAPLALTEELQEFAAPLRQALESIYQATPATVALPVYLVPPSHIPALETIGLVRQYIHEIGASLNPPIAVLPEDVRVAFAPTGNGAADSAIALFDNLSELPGAVLIALDSPIQRDQAVYAKLATSDQRTAMTVEMDERATWRGTPGLAVVAMLLTHPEINRMLATIHDYSQAHDAAFDAMTPFWQKQTAPSGQLAALARINPVEREILSQQPVLARIHRTAFGTTKPPVRPLEMGLYFQALMEKALLAGGLLSESHESDDSLSPSPEGKAPTPPVLTWLVHNAGTVERYGPRLSGLATAIRHFGFDLHPLSEATNFAQSVGDFGAATPWVMLAEAVVRTSDSGAIVLNADFQENDGLAMSTTLPVPVPCV